MKRTIVTAIIAACMMLTASAQDKKHDISLSVGTLPIPYATDNSMTFNASYMHAKNDYISFGGTASYVHADLTPHDEEMEITTGDIFSVMASVRAYWFKDPGCRLYSSASLGVQLQFRKIAPNYDYWKNVYTYMPVDLSDRHEVKVLPAAQLSLIGLELGGETVKAFAELGLGAQGLAQAGLRVRF